MMAGFSLPFNKEVMDWFVNIRSPADIYKNHPSFLVCEIVFYLLSALTFIHAVRNGGRFKYLWLAIVLHGLVVECVSYFVPDIDNFWHAQSMFMFLGKRLPLHVILIFVRLTTAVMFLFLSDPAFLYTATVSVSKMRLKWWAEPFAVGLAVVLLDVPFDIMGIKLLWWTWHDTEPNIFDRHYWVPWTSYYFHASFAMGLATVFHGTHRLFSSVGKFQSAGFFREMLCCVLTGLLSMPLGVVQFMMVYHPLHDTYGIHSEVCVLMVLTIFACIVWAGDRNPTEEARSAKSLFHLDELSVIALLHYLVYILLAVFERPEKIRSVGLHEPVGPCSDTVPVHTAFGHVLSKSKYLCVDSYDEGYYDFNCTKAPVKTDQDWYTVCGSAFPNHAEYICVVSIFSLLGFYFYWMANSRSGGLPSSKRSKIKTS